jgi:hypothetical protein
VLDFMLDRVHAMAHVTLPYALRRRCIEQAPALRKRQAPLESISRTSRLQSAGAF